MKKQSLDRMRLNQLDDELAINNMSPPHPHMPKSCPKCDIRVPGSPCGVSATRRPVLLHPTRTAIMARLVPSPTAEARLLLSARSPTISQTLRIGIPKGSLQESTFGL